MRKMHTWLALSVSAFMLAWLSSGIVMIAPRFTAAPEPVAYPDTIDVQKISPTAAKVLTKLNALVGDSSQIRSVTIKKFADAMVYEIVTARQGVILIDGETGEPFKITAPIAELLAKRYIGKVAGELKIELLTRHELSYPWGPLPVYRGSLAAEPATFYYVSAADGTVTRSDRESRIRNAIASLHTLDPIKLVVQADGFRKGLLILTGFIGIGAVCTGLVLAAKRWS